ncbi:MAG: HAD-IB family phosphatase [Leptospiraceae bacterium]|nr:HAD-IB family phosphatase [Leptospiraceae bacterium]
MARSKRNYAFFDLDYTVIPHDTLFLLGNFVIRRQFWRIYYLLILVPAFGLFLVGLIGPHGLKRAFLCILAGLSAEQLAEWMDDFCARLERLAFPSVLAMITQHRAKGDYLVLNTASPQFYIERLATRLGFDEAIGSQFELKDPMPFWVRPLGPNNKQNVKLDHMRHLLPAEIISAAQSGQDQPGLAGSHAYSDSSADLPLLRAAEFRHVIQPSARLLAMAEKSDWTVHRPPLPFSGKAGKFLTALRQMLGLYPM